MKAKPPVVANHPETVVINAGPETAITMNGQDPFMRQALLDLRAQVASVAKAIEASIDDRASDSTPRVLQQWGTTLRTALDMSAPISQTQGNTSQ